MGIRAKRAVGAADKAGARETAMRRPWIKGPRGGCGGGAPGRLGVAVKGEHEPSQGSGEGASLVGPALSAVLRITRREDTQRSEIRRKSARDQGLERSDAWLRRGASGGVPVLRSRGAADWWSAGDRGTRRRSAAGARSDGAGACSGGAAVAAAALPLPGLLGGVGRGAAGTAPTPLVQRWSSRVGAVGLRHGREQRERASTYEACALGG